jgi:polyphosphate kinase
MVVDPLLKKEVMSILDYNLRDNVNSYVMKEDGSYQPIKVDGEKTFNVHKEFFKISKEEIEKVKLIG